MAVGKEKKIFGRRVAGKKGFSKRGTPLQGAAGPPTVFAADIKKSPVQDIGT